MLAVNDGFLGLRSHGNDIVPLSYWCDFWNGKVDCSHGSGPLSYQFWVLFTRVRYRTSPCYCAPKLTKEYLVRIPMMVAVVQNIEIFIPVDFRLHLRFGANNLNFQFQKYDR